MDDQKLFDEEGRLAALARYRIVGTPRDSGFDKITALVQDVLQVPICAVSLVETNRQWFKSIQGLDATETPRDVAFCAHTILAREPMIIPDALVDARFRSNPLVVGDPGIRSYAGVPLCSPDGYNLGSLCAIDVTPREFSAEQIDILARFAGLVVNEMELRTIAHRDFLTGAATRRAFTDDAEKEIARQSRYPGASSLVMFDLDHFKRVNDAYGHPRGDEVLKAVAAACQEMLRPSDMLGRLGGEEFGILLPEVPATGALALAERLRLQLTTLRFSWAPRLKVTASFGVSAYATGQTLQDWMSVTDQVLYRAKYEGRNKALCGGGLISSSIAA